MPDIPTVVRYPNPVSSCPIFPPSGITRTRPSTAFLYQTHGFHMLSTVLQRLPRPAEDLSGPVLGACLHLLHVVRCCWCPP